MRIVATNMFYNFTRVIHRGIFYSHVQVFDGFWEGDIGDDQKYSSDTRGAEKYPYHHGAHTANYSARYKKISISIHIPLDFLTKHSF